jgi:hypothetical protein
MKVLAVVYPGIALRTVGYARPTHYGSLGS